jgi:hypothetical protein
LDEMTARWSRGEAAYRLMAGQVDAAKEFFTLLASISRQEARGLDARSFSHQAANDTKAFDRHASRLAAVLGVQIGQPGAAADVIWAHIGLERFSHPVHLKGPVAVEGASGRLIDGRARPFVSIHPEMFSQLSVLERPTAILTIENYASFNRQVREIEDGSLVVYTGGFPAAGVIELLSKVLTTVSADVPYLHWGDVDAGCVRIFRPGRKPATRAAAALDDKGIGRTIRTGGERGPELGFDREIGKRDPRAGAVVGVRIRGAPPGAGGAGSGAALDCGWPAFVKRPVARLTSPCRR